VSRIVFLLCLGLASTGYAQRRFYQPRTYQQPTVAQPTVAEPQAIKPKYEVPASAEVDTGEVARWGDRVVVTDGVQSKSAEDILLSMAAAPPVDDSDMFRIYIWGVKGSPELQGLIKTFEHDRYLAPYVAPNPTTGRAWAHVMVLHTNDVMQEWRLKQHGIEKGRKGPILIIQAPLNGHKGDPSIVIDRIDFDSRTPEGSPPKATTSAEELAKRLQSSLLLWNRKLASQGFQPPREAVDNFYGLVTTPPSAPPPTPGGHQQTPPWGPVAPPPPTPINPQWPINGPATPTTEPEVLTVAQIQEAAPGAPPAFILAQYQAKVKDKSAVALAWLIEQSKADPIKEPVTPSPAPPAPVVVKPDGLALFAEISMIALVILKSLEFILPMFGFSGVIVKQLETILERLVARLPQK
jgi:hypothetical protein